MRKKSNVALRSTALILVAAMILAACGDAEEDATSTTGGTDAADTTTGATGEPSGDCPVTVGISLPLTGDFSEPGNYVRQGYEVWAATVNDGGGLLGCPVELIFRDDASDPNTAVADYEQLITVEEVDFIFGTYTSRLVIPTSEVAEENEMVYITPAGAAPDVFNRGLEYLFYAANAVATDQYRYLGEYIAALPEGERPETAAYAGLDDPFAQATGLGFKDLLEAAGVETVFETVYPPDTTDFSTIAAQIADADADLMVGSTIFEDSVGLVRALRELGYQPRMATFTVGPTLPQFPEAVGGAVDGVLSNVAWSTDSTFEGNQDFIADFEGLFGEPANEDAAKAFVVGQLIGSAAEAVGCADSTPECQAAVRDHIRSSENPTIIGPLTFDDAGRPQAADMIQQWIDGEIEIVLPADTPAQTAELVYPKPEW